MEHMVHSMHEIIDVLLPFIVATSELVGISFLFIAYMRYFAEYVLYTFKRKYYPINLRLMRSFITTLNFLMAAEILNSIAIHEISELYVLIGIVVIRVALSLLLHKELDHEEHKEREYKERHKKKEAAKAAAAAEAEAQAKAKAEAEAQAKAKEMAQAYKEKIKG
ncbi:MAG: DUF1622 domain-containing protein [Erysipelotrichaceae bacterium]|nr:DUF1622 domain-containing protein [Erysipelotrichaceae bacterium]MBR3693660.1 DUF1622 domain-containing protein [Erysipelotrichales bacterium]